MSVRDEVDLTVWIWRNSGRLDRWLMVILGFTAAALILVFVTALAVGIISDL